jgi:hypothetical protein
MSTPSQVYVFGYLTQIGMYVEGYLQKKRWAALYFIQSGTMVKVR